MPTNIEKSGRPETNLTPVTAMVNETLKTHVTPLLRERELVATANEIAAQKLPPEDPKRIDFAIKCRELSVEICDGLRAENKPSQEVAVVQNYLAALARLG